VGTRRAETTRDESAPVRPRSCFGGVDRETTRDTQRPPSPTLNPKVEGSNPSRPIAQPRSRSGVWSSRTDKSGRLAGTARTGVVRQGVFKAPREVSVETRPDPVIVEPTDAVRNPASSRSAGVRTSSLWRRGRDFNPSGSQNLERFSGPCGFGLEPGSLPFRFRASGSTWACPLALEPSAAIIRIDSGVSQHSVAIRRSQGREG
jgi:hypothetical protein